MQNRVPFSRTRTSVLIGCLFTLTLSACGSGSDPQAQAAAQADAAGTAAAATTTDSASVQVAALNRNRSNANSGTSSSSSTSTGSSSTSTSTSTGTTTTTTTTTTNTSGTVNTVDEIIADMRTASEKLPIAPAGWGALMGTELYLVDPPSDILTGLPWGVVFEGQGGNYATNTRVQIRNIRFYVKRKSTGQWQLISSSPTVGGMDYPDLSSENGTRQADVRNEPDGGISVRTGGGYCFHFWTMAGRARIPTGDIAASFATYQTRAILNNSAAADDRDQSNYVAYVGLDYWRDEQATFLPDFSNNPGSGHGRFKKVTKNWRPVNFVTMQGTLIATMPPNWQTPYPQQFAPYAITESQLRAAPPPLE